MAHNAVLQASSCIVLLFFVDYLEKTTRIYEQRTINNCNDFFFVLQGDEKDFCCHKISFPKWCLTFLAGFSRERIFPSESH